MKYILMVAFLLPAFSALAAKTVTKELEESRLQLIPHLDSEKQFEKFDKARGALCGSFKTAEAKAEKPSAEYLKQMLLLTDRLLQIEAGKSAMDCFGVYYQKRRAVIDQQLKTMEPALKERLLEELRLAHEAVSDPG